MLQDLASTPAIFTVSTAVYQGPMDLLLALIEREELEITRISLSQVTTPFLDYVRGLKDHRPDQVSGFLVIAARLMQIKSEALLPRPVERETGEEDPGEHLIQQLILYKKYKEISALLRSKEDSGEKTFLRLAPPIRVEAKLDLTDITVNHFQVAMRSILEFSDKAQTAAQRIRTPVISIKEIIVQISDTLKTTGRSTFRNLLADKDDPVGIVVTFLALLELIKQYHVLVFQDSLFDEITVEATATINDEFDLEFQD